MIDDRGASLPAGLADPLHLPVPVPWKMLAVLGALILLAILLGALWRWLRRRRRAPRTPPPAPVPALAPAGIAEAIELLRRRYLESRAYRAACHELSALLRRYFERATRRPISTLTAGEIRRELGETAGSRFFGFLADLQFGRRSPTRNDLEGACDLALEVAEREL